MDLDGDGLPHGREVESSTPRPMLAMLSEKYVDQEVSVSQLHAAYLGR